MNRHVLTECDLSVEFSLPGLGHGTMAPFTACAAASVTFAVSTSVLVGAVDDIVDKETVMNRY
jgi:hypothetical protein